MTKQKLISLSDISIQDLDSDAEFIPLLSSEDEEEMNKEALPDELPILPLRNMVMFPGVVIPITAGRDKSIELIKYANAGNKTLGVVAQINEETEDPGINDIYKIGTVTQILKTLKLPDGNTTIILQGKKRFEIDQLTQENPFLKAKIKSLDEVRPTSSDDEFKAIIDGIHDTSLEIIKENPNIPTEASFAIKNIESDSFLINFVSSNI